MSKRKIRFNFLDVLIILATFLLIMGIIWREELTERIKTRNIENTVTVNCEINAYVTGGEEVYAVKFGEGRTVVYAGDDEVGYIETVTITVPEPETSGDASSASDGDAPPATQTTTETRLYLKAVSRDSGYYIGGETKLFIGGEYELNTKTSEFKVRILTVDEG